MLDIKSDEFRSLLEDEKRLLVVDFWAPWCGPCKALSSTIQKLSEMFGESIKVVKMDLANPGNMNIAREFNVQNIPTIIFFKDSSEKNRVVGIQTIKQLSDIVEKYLPKIIG